MAVSGCFKFTGSTVKYIAGHNLSQHQGLSQRISSVHQVTKVLELQLYHQVLQWYSGLISFRVDWFGLLGLSIIFSSTTIWKHLFLGTQTSLWSDSHICTWLLEKTIVQRLDGPLLVKWCLCFLIHCLGLSQFFFQGTASFNFMAAVTIRSDFGAQENKSATIFIFPHLFFMKWWDQMPWS